MPTKQQLQSINLHDTLTDLWEPFKYGRIMAGNNQFGACGNFFHAVLRAEVGVWITGGSNRYVLIEILIQIHIVTGQNNLAILGVYTDVL